MTKSELKDIIRECYEELLAENKEDIKASYRSRELADKTSHFHSDRMKDQSNKYREYSKTGFSGSNEGNYKNTLNRVHDHENEKSLEGRDRMRNAHKELSKEDPNWYKEYK